MTDYVLPSWRAGKTRDAILAFLERVDEIPPGDRVAVFDNDGTMWCEKPNYTQLEFLVVELRAAITADPSLADKAEFGAILDGDMAADREYAYESAAGTFETDETILATADRLGWTVASMRDDWATIFPDS
jgi:hypothetical protein